MTKSIVANVVTPEEMSARVDIIQDEIVKFLRNAKDVTNKSAARRARVSSMALRTLLKEFKAASSIAVESL